MPSIGKQRRVNRNKVLVKRSQRYAGNSRIKPFNPLYGKLKNNNNLLAKALSIEKQENQLLFSQKIELSSQLQALKLACNKRDMVLANVQKNAKEMLTMLVTMTNHVTNTIVCCQEFSHQLDASNPQPNSVSVARRESTRRLSIKSPARGVVKPMVSGHTITKPTINLRRVNMQRVNNLIDLSIIDERSPDSSNNSTINTSQTHSAAFTSTNRLGYKGERRRRLPERIPVEYVGSDDEEEGTLGNPETRLSGRLSGRLFGRQSNSRGRKRSGNVPSAQIQSPSVSLYDVSKLLQNSQTINIRQLQDSQGSGDVNGLSNIIQNSWQRIGDGDIKPDVDITAQESQEARENSEQTPQSSPALKEVGLEKSTKTINKSNNSNKVDPLEGPSWLLNSSVVDQSLQDTESEETIEILRRAHVARKLSSSESEAEGNNANNDSMEFTECINKGQKILQIPMLQLLQNQNHVDSNHANRFIQESPKEGICSNTEDSDESKNHLRDTEKQCTNPIIHRSFEFVTDRRQRYVHTDDDDDTIMLQFSKAAKTSRFDINDFRLPVLKCPTVSQAEPEVSEPEVTTTIQRIPQNYVPPILFNDDVEDRVSDFGSLQLPKIEDAPKDKKTKRPVKKKQPKNYAKLYETDSSESDCTPHILKKPKKTAKLRNVKDPSSAKVVLQKLNDTHMKLKSTSSDLSLVDKSQNLDTTNQKTIEADNAEMLTNSNSSTHSMNESHRPRRQKAPTNLKEPNLSKKLRRDI